MSAAMTPAAPRQVAIVVGSHHADSQSEKVGRFLMQRLEALSPQLRCFMLPLAHAALPLWSCESSADEAHGWQEISAGLHASDGIVLVTPEWHGMVPAALKNFLLYCDGHELAHKPALLVAVSASDGGAYPIAELRMSGGKNTRLCPLPDHLIVRGVEDVLNDADADADAGEQSLRERIDYTLRVLLGYAGALAALRASGVIDLERYPYGM